MIKICGLLYIAFVTESFAQVKPDSGSIQSRIKKDVKDLVSAISRRSNQILHERSEESFLKYEGKIVRKINLRRIGFEKTVFDTTRTLTNSISKVANKLHPSTRDYVLRNNLFVKEDKPLNPYRLADNERWLRNLNFILDARIYVQPILSNPDSVDLLIITRDVFSLGGSFETNFPTKYRLGIQDINLYGRGQTVQVGQVLDESRSPKYGYGGFYQISNINGTFIDGAIGYSKLDDGVSIGNENESSFYIRLNRTLYQPFARFAGGAEVSYNNSANVYKKPDSAFAQYKYVVQDYWLGYAFGQKRRSENRKENRNRLLFAIRGYDQYFLQSVNTELTEQDHFTYRNRTTILTQLIFFRQDFYKTQYVLGFGRTEDVPYGYRVSVTYGWERELGNRRPYFGYELYYNKVRPNGSILTYDGKLSTYLQGDHSKDGYFSFDFTQYSKIHQIGKMIVRYQWRSGYAAIFNQSVKRGLDIRDFNGLLGFLPDSLLGFQRVTLGHETTLFTPYKLLGFHLAPTARIDLALIQRSGSLIQSGNFFSGFSLGIRARNENLVFNTIDARLFFYPKTVELVEHFRFNVTTNFRIKYPVTLISKPATVFP